ncbi:transposase [Parvibaculum sedimenti]|uniref:Transposase n=1 Tax=Parvibaculum sedimenti TaxID=2608632 RepID=A0A6N6VIR0_9HYPH|nr:transposase [Parvibaculum sedimenti]
MPERYGPYTTCYNRFRRWTKAGIWDRIMGAVTAAHDGDIQMIDGTSVRVSHSAATIKKPPGSTYGSKPRRLTTKIHAVTDATGLLIRLAVTASETHDAVPARELLSGL